MGEWGARVAVGSWLAVTAMGLGCRDAPPARVDESPARERSQATVRDSAGIAIVENDAPYWFEEEAWRVDPVPELRIGTAAGDERTNLERVVGAVTLEDGRIVIGDNGSTNLRVFDSTGAWSGDVGREGEGPGEFGSVRFLRRFAGDSLFVFDWSHQRYHVFTPELAFERTVRIAVEEPGITLPHVKALTASGVPILIGAKPPWVEEPVPHYGQSGHMFVGTRDPAAAFGEEVRHFTGQGVLWKTVYEGLDERVAVASTGRYEILLVGLDGRTLRSIRRTLAPSPIPDSFFEEPTPGPAGTLDLGEHAIVLTQQRPDPDSYPETLPTIEALHVDREGRLWVEHYRYRKDRGEGGGALQPEPLVFSVFEPSGQFLGEVRVPEGIRVLEIGEDWILALVRDELDIEYVERYRLIKPR